MAKDTTKSQKGQKAPGVNFDDIDSGTLPLAPVAPAVTSDKGPELIALQTLVGVPGNAPEISRHQRFYCANPRERDRLLTIGAARPLIEVKAERSKLIVPE